MFLTSPSRFLKNHPIKCLPDHPNTLNWKKSFKQIGEIFGTPLKGMINFNVEEALNLVISWGTVEHFLHNRNKLFLWIE